MAQNYWKEIYIKTQQTVNQTLDFLPAVFLLGLMSDCDTQQGTKDTIQLLLASARISLANPMEAERSSLHRNGEKETVGILCFRENSEISSRG